MPLTYAVSLVNTNLVAQPDDLRLHCLIDPSSGVFGGTFVDPGTGTANRLRGVVLEKQNRRVGCRRAASQTAWIRLEPQPGNP